jgi:precorrin-3B synthase
VCLAPAFGELSAAQVRLIADVSPAAVVTPWRTVVVPEFSTRLLGFSTAGGVSACIGRPGCAKSRADVRADARRVVTRARAHFSGCERRCGKPRGAADVLAHDDGYLVDGTWVPVEGLADALGRKGQG